MTDDEIARELSIYTGPPVDSTDVVAVPRSQLVELLRAAEAVRFFARQMETIAEIANNPDGDAGVAFRLELDTAEVIARRDDRPIVED